MGFLGHLRCFAVLASFSVASAAPVSAQTGGGGSPRPPIRLVNDPAEFGPEGRPGREQHRGEVLDMRAHPELAGMAGRTRELLDRLLIPEDRYREIELVFLDDMRPNATFQKFKSGKARVTVNLGLFDVVDSDDEFAGILGHELEHGHSDLHDRAAEAEVDVRSVVRRVLPNGFNPHALARFFVKMRRKYGDHGGPTHVSSASRWDALALANEKLMADGMKFPADDPKLFRRSVVGPFRELYLLNGTWRDAARARWRADAEKIVGQGRTLLARLDELPVREGVELPEGIERAWGMLKGALEQRAQVLLGDALEDPKLAAEIRRETRAGVWGLYAERVRTLDHARAMSTTQGLEVVAAVLARPGVWQEYSLPVIARGLLAREALAAGGEHSRYDEAELKEQAAQVAEAERWFQPWSEVEAAAREYSATARRDPEGEGRRARLEEAHWGRAKSPLREAVGADRKSVV